MAQETLNWQGQELSGHPDLMILNKEEKGSIGIEKIRDLINWLSLKPFQSKTKVVFIQEAQNLTPESQNALLKTLEEPPGNCQIILTAPHKSWLIPTVVSRCALVHLGSQALDDDRAEGPTRLTELMAMGLGERLDFSETNKEIFSDRDQTLKTVDDWLTDLKGLLKGRDKAVVDNISALSRGLFELKKDLATTNVNARNLVDLFLLKAPQLQIQPDGLQIQPDGLNVINP